MKTIVFSFARMNPPTTGHSRLISKVVEMAKALSADHAIYLSQTQNEKTDPLDWNFKHRICESAFPGINFPKDVDIKTPFQALSLLALAEDYEKIIFIVGSDRVDDFTERMTPYAEELPIDFEIVSAGERIAESSSVEGMSASKLRQYALDNNDEKFFEGLPNTMNMGIKKLVLKNTKKGMIPKR